MTLALFVFAASLIFAAHARTGAQTKRPAAAAAQTILFAVTKYETGVTMEPVALYSRGVYTKPPIDGDEAAVRSFVDNYFKPGRQYRVVSGGGDAGTLTVKRYQEQGCVGLNADVSVNTSARLGGNVMALATNSPSVGRGQPERRAPTELERILALTQAQNAYTSNGVGAALAKKMQVVNLTATDLDADGNFELIGSYRVDRKTANAEESFTLFMISTPVGAEAAAAGQQPGRPALVWFHRGGEADFEERRFVDQLDIDGDGVAEVIAGGYYYESNDYVIYKKQRGSWRVVYQGGGGGC